jgi:hypothetical protein
MAAIGEPGIFDLDEATYHGDPCPAPSLSAGVAKRLLEATPYHAAADHPRLRLPDLPDEEPEHEPKFDLGRATHAVKTGKGGAIVEVEAKDWRTGAAKDARAAAVVAGNTALLTSQAERVRLMCDLISRQLRADPAIGCDPFADRDRNELAMIWRDGPIWCRAKPDAIDYDRRILWDLKTTDGLADPDAWTQTQLRATAIDLRAAHYLHGARALLGPGWRYVFVVAEARRPHAISVVELPASTVETGEDKRRRASARWAECVALNFWPAWPPGFNRPEVPDFHEARWLERRDRHPSPAEVRASLDLAAGSR